MSIIKLLNKLTRGEQFERTLIVQLLSLMRAFRPVALLRNGVFERFLNVSGEKPSGTVANQPEKPDISLSQNNPPPNIVEQLPAGNTQQQQINPSNAAFNANQVPAVNSQVPSNVQAPAVAPIVPTNPAQQASQADIAANSAPVSIPSRKTSAPLENTRLDVEKPLEQKISVCSLKEEGTKTETGKTWFCDKNLCRF